MARGALLRFGDLLQAQLDGSIGYAELKELIRAVRKHPKYPRAEGAWLSQTQEVVGEEALTPVLQGDVQPPVSQEDTQVPQVVDEEELLTSIVQGDAQPPVSQEDAQVPEVVGAELLTPVARGDAQVLETEGKEEGWPMAWEERRGREESACVGSLCLSGEESTQSAPVTPSALFTDTLHCPPRSCRSRSHVAHERVTTTRSASSTYTAPLSPGTPASPPPQTPSPTQCTPSSPSTNRDIDYHPISLATFSTNTNTSSSSAVPLSPPIATPASPASPSSFSASLPSSSQTPTSSPWQHTQTQHSHQSPSPCTQPHSLTQTALRLSSSPCALKRPRGEQHEQGGNRVKRSREEVPTPHVVGRDVNQLLRKMVLEAECVRWCEVREELSSWSSLFEEFCVRLDGTFQPADLLGKACVFYSNVYWEAAWAEFLRERVVQRTLSCEASVS